MELLLVLRNRITKSTGTTPYQASAASGLETSSLISGTTRGATFTLPTFNADDFIFIFNYVQDDGVTLNTPTGYTQFGTQQTNFGGSDFALGVFYRRMDGTEGSTVDLTFEYSTNEVMRPRMWSIRNAKEFVGQVSTSGYVSSNSFVSVDIPWSNSRDTYQIAYIAERQSGVDFDNNKLTNSPYNWVQITSGASIDAFEKTERISVMQPRGGSFNWGGATFWTQCTLGFRG